jgi:hypothetical protein
MDNSSKIQSASVGWKSQSHPRLAQLLQQIHLDQHRSQRIARHPAWRGLNGKAQLTPDQQGLNLIGDQARDGDGRPFTEREIVIRLYGNIFGADSHRFVYNQSSEKYIIYERDKMEQ